MKGFGGSMHNDEGIVIVYVAIFMVVFLGFTALAVDVGYMMVGRSELQRTADAAALAATRQLGVLYEGMDYQTQDDYDAQADEGLIKTAATDVAARNRAAGDSVVIDPADVTIGRWRVEDDPHFSENTARANAVRVVARRDTSATSTGPINTFFARILGIDNVNVSAPATAALTSQTTMTDGGLPVPLAISSDKVCDNIIQLHPTKDSCAGWHGFFDGHSDSLIDEILNRSLPVELRDKKYKNLTKYPPFESPEVTANLSRIDLSGGDQKNNIVTFQTLFDYMKDKDGDGNDNVWTTSVVIYQGTGSCTNPNGPTNVLGFADFEITCVNTATHAFQGQLRCGYVQPGRGGGSYDEGTLGSLPGLVE